MIKKVLADFFEVVSQLYSNSLVGKIIEALLWLVFLVNFKVCPNREYFPLWEKLSFVILGATSWPFPSSTVSIFWPGACVITWLDDLTILVMLTFQVFLDSGLMIKSRTVLIASPTFWPEGDIWALALSASLTFWSGKGVRASILSRLLTFWSLSEVNALSCISFSSSWSI